MKHFVSGYETLCFCIRNIKTADIPFFSPNFVGIKLKPNEHLNMKKQFLFSLLALSVATGMKAEGDEARLLRFPTTNGTDVVFTYAGDLYTAPLNCLPASRRTVKPSPLRASMTATAKST